jgi:PAS domain S-box-containing protein
MDTRPAIEDHTKRAGYPAFRRDSGRSPQPAHSRSDSWMARGVGDELNDSTRDDKQRMFSLLFDRVSGFAYRCRPDTERTMEYISDGCFQLTGYHPADLVNNRTIAYGQIILPQDREMMWQILTHALGERISFDLTYRIQTSTNQEKWVREIGREVNSPGGESIALEGIILDITDRKFSEKLLQRQVERFEALRKIDMAITGSFDLRVTLDILLDQVITHLGVDAADVLSLDPEAQTLEYASGKGFRTGSLQHTRLRLGEGFAGIAALEHRTVRVDKLAESLGDFRRAPQITSEGFHSYIGIPLVAKGQVKGILEIFHRSPFEPDADWMEFLEALAGQAAIAIENATLFNELQRSNVELSIAYDATLESWSKVLELRDQGLEGHTQRVNELTIRLAQSLGVDPANLVHIRRGALLHDIGVLAIPENILSKPGPLSDDEWDVVRQHPVHAYKLLSSIPNLRPSLDIPYCHHEKWDGTGYPRGLEGEQIPLPARIFAVADVWDTLLSDRPFRKAWPKDKAVAYLRDQKGKHFEPRIVDVFLSTVARKAV